jgi:hypothetical protein
MSAYIGMKPHMDVTTHHTTVSGNFAMTVRSGSSGAGLRRQADRNAPSRDESAPQAA